MTAGLQAMYKLGQVKHGAYMHRLVDEAHMPNFNPRRNIRFKPGTNVHKFTASDMYQRKGRTHATGRNVKPCSFPRAKQISSFGTAQRPRASAAQQCGKRDLGPSAKSRLEIPSSPTSTSTQTTRLVPARRPRVGPTRRGVQDI